VNNELERMEKDLPVAKWGIITKFTFETREIHRIPDLKLGSLEYEIGMLSNPTWYSVKICNERLTYWIWKLP
jgi:hypothetical protein